MKLKFGDKIVFTKKGEDYLCFVGHYHDDKFVFLNEIMRGMEYEGCFWEWDDFSNGKMFLRNMKKSKWRFATKDEVHKGRVLS